MGNVYDLEEIDDNPKCSDVKGIIIYIDIFGSSISFIFLILSIVLIIRNSKKLSPVTVCIIFIFCSEIINTISKMLQLLKYGFDDTRMNNDTNEIETPRGIICQIQIVTSIFSDFCTLLGTLLLSARCVKEFKEGEGLLHNIITGIISLISIVLFSLILVLGLLFLDRELTKESISYKFDSRDRCTYWCWVAHTASIICYLLYFIILIFNIIYACRTKSDLNNIIKEKKKKFDDLMKDDNEKNDNQAYLISEHDKKIINHLTEIKSISLIYPIIVCIIWGLQFLYRFFDEIVMPSFDSDNNREKVINKEKEYFSEHPGLRLLSEITLVLHAIFSAFRGIFFGFCFLVFQRRAFCSFLGKWCKCFDKISKYIFGDNENRIINDQSVILSKSMGRETVS